MYGLKPVPFVKRGLFGASLTPLAQLTPLAPLTQEFR